MFSHLRIRRPELSGRAMVKLYLVIAVVFTATLIGFSFADQHPLVRWVLAVVTALAALSTVLIKLKPATPAPLPDYRAEFWASDNQAALRAAASQGIFPTPVRDELVERRCP